MSGCQDGQPISQEIVELQISPSTEGPVTKTANKKKFVLLNVVLDFLKGFVSSIGIGYDVTPWHIACVLALLFAVLYWGVAYGSLYFIRHDYASFWAPNGVFAGALCRSRPRARRLILLAVFASMYLPRESVIVNLAFGNAKLISMYYVILNSIESVVVTSISLGLVRVLLPGKLSLLHREHLISVGLGVVLGCSISSNLSVNFARWKLSPPHSYGMTYLGYFGRNLVGNALVIPLILSVPSPNRVRDLPCAILSVFRTKSKLIMQAMAVFLILVIVPTISAFLVSGSPLSTVAGLYVTYPAVLFASAKFGLVGASGASLVVGLSSAISTLIWSHGTLVTVPSSMSLSPQDQFVWIHLFLVVLVTTSIFFVIILSERDIARTNIEHEVHQRTEELLVANSKLDEALLKAETADNDKAVFFSFLCHELRNPLHVISHMTNTLEENHGTRIPEIKAIKSSSKYMLALVSDVLDLGRFEAGRVILENLTVDIHALLETNLACAAQMAETHKIFFESYVDPAIPPWLSVDAIRLQQIFNNFISNAFKFTPKGGRIRVEVRAIKFFRGANPLLAQSPDALPVSLSCRETLIKRQRSASIAPSPEDDAIPAPSHNPTQAVSLGTMMKKSKRAKWRKWMRLRRPKDGNARNTETAGNASARAGGGRTAEKGVGGVEGVRASVDPNSSLPPLVHSESSSSRVSRVNSYESSNNNNRSQNNLASSSELHTSTFTLLPTHSASDSSVASGVLEERREGEEARGREGEEEWVTLEVSVADTGIGIDPAIVSKLFRPYAQAAVSTMREYH